MKDKIKELLKEFYPAVYFMMNDRTEERFNKYIDRVEKYNKELLDLIAKEFPKEKEYQHPCCVKGTCIRCAELEGYNQCLKDIKHNLGVEDYEPFKIGKIIKKNC